MSALCIIVIGVLVAAIAGLVGYSIGCEHSTGLGNPKPQQNFPPGVTYEPFPSTTLATPRRDGSGYDERFFGLLQGRNGKVTFAKLDEQLPEGKTVRSYRDKNGRIRFECPQEQKPKVDFVA